MKKCINCDKKISFYAKRCIKCDNKRKSISENNPMFGIHRFGKDSPRFIDGRTNKKCYCKDCHKEISGYEAIRCNSCNIKYLYKIEILSNFGRHLTKESKRKMSLTKGGTGIPYEFNKYPDEYWKIRYKILKRDNHICQLCKEEGNEVHHIDYNKQNNEQYNLITLCRKCNMKVNQNRIQWTIFFIGRLNESVSRN